MPSVYGDLGFVRANPIFALTGMFPFFLLASKAPNNAIKYSSRELYREFLKEESEMAERHSRKCSTSLDIWEMQVKPLWDTILLVSELLKSVTPKDFYAWEHVQTEEVSSITRVSTNFYNHFGIKYGVFSGKWDSIYLKIQQFLSWAYTERMHIRMIRSYV